MPTPFDNRLLLVHWIARPLRPTRDVFGNIDPRANELGFSARDFCHWGTVGWKPGGINLRPDLAFTAKGPNSSIEKKASSSPRLPKIE